MIVGPGYARSFGGKKIIMSGPCFKPGAKVACRFGGLNGVSVPGVILTNYKASCVTPTMWQRGLILLEVSLNGGTSFRYRGNFYIGNTLFYYHAIMLHNGKMWYTLRYGLYSTFIDFLTSLHL